LPKLPNARISQDLSVLWVSVSASALGTFSTGLTSAFGQKGHYPELTTILLSSGDALLAQMLLYRVNDQQVAFVGCLMRTMENPAEHSRPISEMDFRREIDPSGWNQ
jgi:hypothetical protein